MLRKVELVSINGLLVFQRIVELAATRGMDLHGLAMRYALERFLARVYSADAPKPLTFDASSTMEIGQDSITLKGGLTMFIAEGVHPLDGRATSDADFHVTPTADGGHSEQFMEFLRTTLGHRPGGFDDGVTFDLSSLAIASVKDGNVPGGKVTVVAQLGKLAVKIRSDIAFDSRPINEQAGSKPYPNILPDDAGPPIMIRHTPWEYVVADKLQAAVRLGIGNYRMRDYYDLYVILKRGLVEPEALAEAVRVTFDLYGSTIPESVDDMPALGAEYVALKSARWDSERETKQFGDRAPDLHEVVDFLRERIDPVLSDLSMQARPF
jgi:hypothetical protein